MREITKTNQIHPHLQQVSKEVQEVQEAQEVRVQEAQEAQEVQEVPQEVRREAAAQSEAMDMVKMEEPEPEETIRSRTLILISKTTMTCREQSNLQAEYS